MLKEEPHLHIDTDDAGVRRLIVDHPPVNVLGSQLTRELYKAAAMAADDPAVRVVVLQSAHPDFFLAHFDVQVLIDLPPVEKPVEELNGFHRLCEVLRTMPKPTIAMIDGRVGGGGAEVAASCDMRFGSPRTVLNQMEVPLGLLPGGSGTQRIPRLVGRGRAMEIILGAIDVDAELLNEWGWLNRVLPTNELGPFVEAFAARMASFPADALAKAKAAVLASQPDPTSGLLVEGQLFQELVASPDAKARMTAFIDRGGQQPEAEVRMGDFATELG